MSSNEAIGQVIQTAKTEIGVREIGTTNTGERVQQYQSTTTLSGTGWPWCAAFVAWVIKYALGADVAAQVWFPSASCDALLDWARRKKIIITAPVVGCVGLVMSGTNNATHTFIVVGVDTAAQTFDTVEGNSNNTGSREGNGVYSHRRQFESRYLFIDWASLLPSNDVWTLLGSDGHVMANDLVTLEGCIYIQAKTWGTWFGHDVSWNADTQQVLFDGKPLLKQPRLQNGSASFPIRTLANFDGLNVTADGRTIKLSRKAVN